MIGNTVFEFLQSWYGPPPRRPASPAANGALPLREWWSYEEAWGIPLSLQNRVLASEEVYQDADHAVFYVENQAVWLWAHGEGRDPDVYDRENEPGTRWEKVGERLSTFLHHVAVFEAVLGADMILVANNVDGAVVRGVVDTLLPSPFVDWRWPGPGSNVRESRDCLVFAAVNDRPESQVDDTALWMLSIAARTAEALSEFDAFGIDWDYDGRYGGEGCAQAGPA